MPDYGTSEFAIAGLVLDKGEAAVTALGDRLSLDLFENPHCIAVVGHCMKQVEKGKYVDLKVMPPKLLDSTREIMLSDGYGASMSHLEHHISELETQADRRRLDAAATLIKERITQDDVAGLESAVQEMLYTSRQKGSGIVDSKESVIKTMAALEEQITNENAIMGFDTGFRILNRLTQGQMRKKLWVVAGRPGGCKSLLAMMFADAAMKRSGAKVMVISMEMGHDEWTERWISHYAQVNLQDALVQKLPSQLERLNSAAAAVAKLPYSVCDKSKLTRSALVRVIRQAASKGFNYIVLDHLGLMRFAGTDLRLEMGEVSSELRGLAKSLDIHITVLIQLNRRAEEAMEHGDKPSLRHLAEADGPGQDCDVCLMIDTDGALVVAKNRKGRSGDTIETDRKLETYTIREAEVATPEEVARAFGPPGAVS